MKLVWDETLLIVEGLFDIWKGKDSIEVDHVTDITMMVYFSSYIGSFI